MSGDDPQRDGERVHKSTDLTAGPLVPYMSSSDETTPLLAGKPLRAISRDGFKFIIYSTLALLVLLFVTVNLYLHFINCPLYPEAMNAIRHGWQKEVAEHDVVREGWRLEQQHHAVVEEKWKLKVEEQEHEYEEMERRESLRQEKEREKWQHEVEEHDKIVEKRKKQEEEERQKLNMFWGHVEAHACITYGTREYTAQLMNLPTTWEHRIEACKVTPIEIHGNSYLPTSCEDKGPGVVIGRWDVNQHEPACASFWLWYKDKESHFPGCTSPGSGKRRIEHYLENLPKGGDWREFCAMTPAYFHGMAFVGAEECFQSNGGTYGHWEIDDTSCL